MTMSPSSSYQSFDMDVKSPDILLESDSKDAQPGYTDSSLVYELSSSFSTLNTSYCHSPSGQVIYKVDTPKEWFPTLTTVRRIKPSQSLLCRY